MANSHNIMDKIAEAARLGVAMPAQAGYPADFGATGFKADVLAESTATAGVTVDGLLLKDATIDTVAGTALELGPLSATSVTVTPAATFAAGATVSASQTLAVTTADKATVGGVILPQEIEITGVIMPHASLTEYNLFTATLAYQVTAIRIVPNLAQGGALTATICKVASTSTPVKTTTPMHTADAIDLNATAHTVQTITLTVTTADLQLAAGNRIGIDLSAALTTGSATWSIRMKRI